MKEIETLVEEKTKESLDVSRLTREGERTELRATCSIVEAARRVIPVLAGQHPPPPSSTTLTLGQPWGLSQHGSGLILTSASFQLSTGLPPGKSAENWPLVKK